jgi:hypothetical protein
MSVCFWWLFCSCHSALPLADAELKHAAFDLLSFTVIAALISVYDTYTKQAWLARQNAAAGIPATADPHARQCGRFTAIGNGGISVNTWLF